MRGWRVGGVAVSTRERPRAVAPCLAAHYACRGAFMGLRKRAEVLAPDFSCVPVWVSVRVRASGSLSGSEVVWVDVVDLCETAAA